MIETVLPIETVLLIKTVLSIETALPIEIVLPIEIASTDGGGRLVQTDPKRRRALKKSRDVVK